MSISILEGGPDGGLRRASTLDYRNPYTVGGWFKPSDNGWQMLFSFGHPTLGHEEYFYHSAPVGLGFDCYDDAGGSASWQDNGTHLLTLNDWWHVAFRRTGTLTVEIIINGRQIADHLHGGFGTRSAGTDFNIGIGMDESSIPLSSALKDMFAYDVALTDDEIAAQRVSASIVRAANNWAFWKLPSNSDLTDSSGNGRNMTAVGTVSTHTPEPPYDPTTYGAAGKRSLIHGGFTFGVAG